MGSPPPSPRGGEMSVTLSTKVYNTAEGDKYIGFGNSVVGVIVLRFVR